MPGYDGTGPRGDGPLTGRGDGYCVIKLPDDPREIGTGFMGLCGTPMAFDDDRWSSPATRPPAQMAGIQRALHTIKCELEDLEAAARQMRGPDRDSA